MIGFRALSALALACAASAVACSSSSGSGSGGGTPTKFACADDNTRYVDSGPELHLLRPVELRLRVRRAFGSGCGLHELQRRGLRVVHHVHRGLRL